MLSYIWSPNPTITTPICETRMNLNHQKTDQKYKTDTNDQRAYPRVPACNLVSYAAVNRNGDITHLRMGRALDVSQNGIYLETPQPVISDYISLVTSDLEDNMIEIKGKIAHSRRAESGECETGIRFLGTHDENIQIVKSLVKSRVR